MKRFVITVTFPTITKVIARDYYINAESEEQAKKKINHFIRKYITNIREANRQEKRK